MSCHTITVQHLGEEYLVTLDICADWEDDSFNCHKNGRDAVEEYGHWAINWDETTIDACDGPDGEIDPEEVDGLIEAICEIADQIDLAD